MNLITMHAVGLARCGNWKLLDALEVRARASREPTFAGLAHATGSVAMLGYLDEDRQDAGSDPMRCPECEGDGEIEIIGASGRTKYTDCPWCDGEGEVDGEDLDLADAYISPAQCRRWATLNGDTIEVDFDYLSQNCWMSIADATRVIAEYSRLVSALTTTTQVAK